MARKKVAQAEKENSERWLLTYADMITLLVAFFVILYAQSKADPVKFSQLALSFQRAFNVGVMAGQQGTGHIIGSGGRVGQIEVSTFQYLSESVGKFAEQQGLTDEVSIGSKREGVTISLHGNILFASGAADLRPEGRLALDQLASVLRPLPNDLRVEGHTDNVPISSKDFPANWDLSVARALAVTRYLVEQGIEPNRIGAAGYGEFRPVVPNTTRENRARNRRVDIIVLDMNIFGPATPVPAKSGASRETP